MNDPLMLDLARHDAELDRELTDTYHAEYLENDVRGMWGGLTQEATDKIVEILMDAKSWEKEHGEP